MERRYRIQLDELLEDAEIPPGLLHGVMPRLESFLQPFVDVLASSEQRTNARHYVQGLLSDLPSKDAESIAYLHDRERQGLQKFIGQALWDHRPLLDELVHQVGTHLAQPESVLVLDPSAFPKKGTESVGVARQWCGRLGKVENCQVGIYLGYVSRVDHALVDVRLYLPREWTKDRKRLKKAGAPKEVRFRTRHELALEMLDEHGPKLPHAWVAGDDEMGRNSWFRQQLRQRGEHYLLAVPSNTLVQDLAAPEPGYNGRGRRPKQPFMRADRWCAGLPQERWQTVEVRAGEKGPLVVEAAWALVQARSDGKPSGEVETLVVFRERQGKEGWKHDYLLSDTALTASVQELARVYKAEHRIEQSLKQAKSEAGLGDYQVRSWEGWHHHQTLSMMASWFLTQETERGKKTDSGTDGTATASAAIGGVESSARLPATNPSQTHCRPPIAPQRGGTLLPLATT